MDTGKSIKRRAQANSPRKGTQIRERIEVELRGRKGMDKIFFA